MSLNGSPKRGVIGKLGGAAACLTCHDALLVAVELREMAERNRKIAALAGKVASDADCVAASLEAWEMKARERQSIPDGGERV